VLKILDHKFKKPPQISQSNKDEDDYDFGYELPAQLRNSELMIRIREQNTSWFSKSIDTTMDSDAKLFGSKVNEMIIAKAEELTVKNLSKFLKDHEIELV